MCWLFLIWLLVSGCVWADQPPPVLLIGNQPPQNPLPINEKQPPKNQSVTIKSPVEVKLLNTGKTTEEIDQENRERQDKSSSDRWLVLLTGILGVIAFLQFLAFVVQACYLGKTFASTKDTAKKELRAYVSLDDIFFRWILMPGSSSDDRKNVEKTHSDRGPPRVRIRIRNFGKTPARNLRVRTNSYVMSVTVDQTYETINPTNIEPIYVNRNHPSPRSMLFPTQSYETWVHSAGSRFDPHLPYDPEKKILVVHVAIIYQDIYDLWRVATFCYRYDGANRFIPHTEFNEEFTCKTEEEAKDCLPYA